MVKSESIILKNASSSLFVIFIFRMFIFRLNFHFLCMDYFWAKGNDRLLAWRKYLNHSDNKVVISPWQDFCTHLRKWKNYRFFP
ncbi:hypothetical protein M0811_11735 [Anaeramoeba ignava]|uniref:Uncharacterized protein n=1 Tax=Anaeramoeba ignava TaxID=1746090 RepID=A0A9Q0LB73_ANAIG|nr:hypothetical protein M0811_11735 [Anaeramoeba ignava]